MRFLTLFNDTVSGKLAMCWDKGFKSQHGEGSSPVNTPSKQTIRSQQAALQRTFLPRR